MTRKILLNWSTQKYQSWENFLIWNPAYPGLKYYWEFTWSQLFPIPILGTNNNPVKKNKPWLTPYTKVVIGLIVKSSLKIWSLLNVILFTSQSG